jgi:hypothetical protein
MASTSNASRYKLSGRPKNNNRPLKRKRDIDDHEKLQKAIDELVIILMAFKSQSLTPCRTPRGSSKIFPTCLYLR